MSLSFTQLGSPYAVKKPRVEFYQDKSKPPHKEWWWRLYFSSDIVAASSEGYSNKREAIENFLKIEKHIQYIREYLQSQLT